MNKHRTKPLYFIVIILVTLFLCSCSENVDFNDSYFETTTVYITKTGQKYHIGSCRHLKLSKIEIDLDDAKDRGYTPCSVCEPPV